MEQRFAANALKSLMRSTFVCVLYSDGGREKLFRNTMTPEKSALSHWAKEHRVLLDILTLLTAHWH